MKFLDKIKLLFLIQKPAGEVADAVAEAKKTKKWIHFAATVLGILISLIGSLTGYLSPQAEILITSALNAIYNIVRGADKADNADVKGTFTTTEFWLSVVNEAQKFVVARHGAGASGPLIEYIGTAANTLGLILGQNLAARAPLATTKP